MRFTQLLVPTLKDDPADAEVVSHKLLVRAAMIRQVARGIYDYLPLGLRVLRNVETIVRAELDAAGCQEILMPAVCPAELWQESGRWDRYGKELLRIKDRNERDFCFGPTHEEVVTDIVRKTVRSYRDLPKNLYQIQTKFRDEIRPRFGLMRGREFLMKDGYSFHADRADCEREYRHMYETYERIFDRCGLRFRAVEADTGAIGGSMSHEFQVLAESGEDAIVACTGCSYAANVEKAELPPDAGHAHAQQAQSRAMERVATPGKRTIEEVSGFLGMAPDRFIKTIVFATDDGGAVVALVRGDHQISEAKLKLALGAQWVALADAETVHRTTGASVGFAGPVGLEARIVADHALNGIRGAVTGANREDEHLVGVEHGRDFGKGVTFADLRQAHAGDPCPRCSKGRFEEHRGIEVGQVFYLGTKYSKALGATFLDAGGQEHPIEMGTYGIGVSRTVAAAVEQNHDKDGIIWPLALSPFPVEVVPTSVTDEPVRDAAEKLHGDLRAQGVDALIDDRDERPGVKFKDADLIGFTLRLTVGQKGLAKGVVELRERREKTNHELSVADAAARVAQLVRESGRIA
ncbi:MAG: proline--tRNA ligase [Deltaproteobacteria bacterium]|nr:proline--tRNA ligase [Deltaproteobacteria bacterium]